MKVKVDEKEYLDLIKRVDRLERAIYCSCMNNIGDMK